MRRDPRLLAIVAVALVAGGIGWADAVRPAPEPAAAAVAQAVPLASRTLVCPQTGGNPSVGASRIAFADAGPDDTTATGPSSLTTAPVDPQAVSSPVKVTQGHAWSREGPKTLGPVKLSASGQLARSLAATQITQHKIADTLQLSMAQCDEPITEAWFVGFSTGVGSHATLLLSNVDDAPATVDVGIYGDASGPNPEADHGVPVAPHTQVAVRLDTLAPGFANVVAHVKATAGRVVPAVRYDAENGSIPLGVEWVPRAAAPATMQVVPGIVGGDGARRLILADTADLDATVQITLVTPDGSFTPTGMDAVTVPAGQVTSVDLAPALQGAAAAVVVSSTQPVAAGAFAALPPNAAGGSDIGFAAAVPALSGAAIVAGGEIGESTHTQLLLTAPDDDALLELTAIPSAAESTATTTAVTVPGGTTLAVDLGSLTKDPAPGVKLVPQEGGDVFAAWSVQEAAADLTSFPLRSQARSLQRPPVDSDLMAGLPQPLSQEPSPSPSSSSQPTP